MINEGYTNVRTIEGGGKELEKYLEHYKNGKIINPFAAKKYNYNSYKSKRSYK